MNEERDKGYRVGKGEEGLSVYGRNRLFWDFPSRIYRVFRGGSLRKSVGYTARILEEFEKNDSSGSNDSHGCLIAPTVAGISSILSYKFTFLTPFFSHI